MTTISLEPIGFLETCFKEKFSVPRQAGLIEAAWGRLELTNDERMLEAVHELESFDYVWLICYFHQHEKTKWSGRVRPPRLGGEKSVGVFASRSPVRPNPVGLSCCKLESVVRENSKVIVNVSGVDLVNGTPVLDIKPYIAYCDSYPEASAGWLSEDWPELDVKFSEEVNLFLEDNKIKKGYPKLRNLIEQCLKLDPRPAQQRKGEKKSQYAFRLEDFDVCFEIQESGACLVTKLVDLRS